MFGYTRNPIDPTTIPTGTQLTDQYTDLILANSASIDNVGYFPDDEDTLLTVIAEGIDLIRHDTNADRWQFTVGNETRIFIAQPERDDYDLYLPAANETLLVFNLIKLAPEIGVQLGILGPGIITT